MAPLSSAVQRVDVHVWYLVVGIATFWTSCSGQAVMLVACNTGQSTPHNVYFAEAQSTAEIGSNYLPACTVAIGSGAFLRLEKTDGSLRISERGPLTGAVTTVPWNTTAHPTLNTSYSGTYVCRTSSHTSTQVYRISVVQRIVVTQQPPWLLVHTTGRQYGIMADVIGMLPVSISWTSSATLATQVSSRTSFSFRGNDSGISVGLPFSVNLTAQYTADIPCAGNTPGRGFALPQTVIDKCNDAALPSQGTTTVTAQPTCIPLPISNISIQSIPRHPVNTSVNVAVLCIEGYGDPTPTAIQCMAGGKWSAQPYCSPVDECMTGNNNCEEVCTDTTPGYKCSCYDGTQRCIGALVAATPPTMSSRAIFTPTDSSSMLTVKSTQADDTYTLVVVIGAAAGGTAFGLVLMLLMVMLIQKHRKTHQSPAPADTSVPTAENGGFEDADVNMTEVAMTSSDAYGVLDVPHQPNYDYVLP